VGQSGNVDLNQPGLRLPIGMGVRSTESESGIVDENSHRLAGGLAVQEFASRGVGQIGRDHPSRNAIFAPKALRQRGEAVAPPCYQN